MLRFRACEWERGWGSVLHRKHPGSHNTEVVINFLDEVQTNLNLARPPKYISRLLNIITLQI